MADEQDAQGTPEQASGDGGGQSAEEVASAALDAAQAAVSKLGGEGDKSEGDGAQGFEMPTFSAGAAGETPEGIDLLSDVNLTVKIELGRTRMLVDDVLRLAEGSVVELDKLAGDPVDVFVNDRAVARGEVLVLNDNFCIRISEILTGPGDAA